MNYKKEIIAVLDPMCSWCWGFAPTLNELRKNLPKDTKLTICMGGLRASGEQVWNDEFKNYLKVNWDNVTSTTSQKFNLDILKKVSFDYDTQPACKAVLCVQQMDKTQVFDFLHILQKAFYEEAKDITDEETIITLVKDIGLDIKQFTNLYNSKKLTEATLADKYKARSMGANSFPSLVFIDEEGHLYVLKGYRTFDEIQKHL